MCDVVKTSPTWEKCRAQIESDLSRFKLDLAPLETGQMHVGERIASGQWVDVTLGAISSQRRVIATLEAVLAAINSP